MGASETLFHSIINVQRYPVEDLTTPRGRVEKCQRELAETNVCVLLEFVTEDVVAGMARESRSWIMSLS